MMLSSKEAIFKSLRNVPGRRLKRKLVVFESDDWGSIRMPSIEVFDGLSRMGFDFLSDDGFRFNKYDSLASSEDLTLLFEVLSSVRDSKGMSAIFTPVSVVANPDFTKIAQSDFAEYFYEPFNETLKKYPGCEGSFRLWKEGIEKGLFMPQFHGREHLNVKVWMKALKGGHVKARQAFNNRMWGISTANDPSIKIEFQAAFDFIDPDDLKYHEEQIISGLNLFEKLFGYRATYFVPPNGPFSTKLEPVCKNEGIKYFSAPKIQFEPLGFGTKRRRIHWLGQNLRSDLICITRNCFFEPSLRGQNWIDTCLSEISNAFKWHKPAVVSSHRVNYIGALNSANREIGMSQLSLLLKGIVKAWPDIEFVSSDKLGEIISEN